MRRVRGSVNLRDCVGVFRVSVSVKGNVIGGSVNLKDIVALRGNVISETASVPKV